ncbi:hypothetical protein CVT26_002263 [Gymnopilus dilepis]|uniref:FAD-binding PCMH-type domain-containing protein n=1 Tax=Gymnopilus dilepis TaxID=231916 RepID=A0A409YP57_9AGAR|nr:hypothetical protein CVT26_002263 [Gymnopilus dilepis]
MTLLTSLVSSLLLLKLSDAGSATTSDWNALNRTVGGRLKAATPFARPCFSLVDGGKPNMPNATACTEVQSRWEDHLFRSDNFGAYEVTQWETCQTTGDECLLDFTNPANPAAFTPPAQCRQGSVPNFYIDITGPDDILAAFDFSKKSGVPLVIKNSGHDYIGRSSGPGTLALWTHHLQNISLSRSFVPEGCSSRESATAITIGAGQQFRSVYDFAAANNVTVVGGSDPAVGLSGGWVMGGGHSAISPALGLGADRVLQFKIVTPDGRFRVANKCQNQDLFWALRGGGGGTFGVVLESTHLASPRVQVQGLLALYDNTPENTAKLIPALAKTAVQFAADGWGGYITPSNSSGVWANPLLNSTQAKKSAAAVAEAFASVGGNTTLLTFDTFTGWFNAFIGSSPDPVGIPQALASRLIPAEKFSDKTLIQGITNASLAADFSQILAVPPFAFKDFDPQATSVNPLWRKAVWHSAILFTWNFDSTLAQRVGQYQKLTELWSVVRQQTPGGGAYVNEADVFEPNFSESFWGKANYAKLLSIKNK